MNTYMHLFVPVIAWWMLTTWQICSLQEARCMCLHFTSALSLNDYLVLLKLRHTLLQWLFSNGFRLVVLHLNHSKLFAMSVGM